MRAFALCRQVMAVVLAAFCANPLSARQLPSIAAEKPGGFVMIRPYKPVFVPPIRVSNSLRLRDLVRAGRLYLTAQDAIALALENNIDLEIDRYNPLLDVWHLERAEAGGALPGVPSGNSQAGTVASGQGVSGSTAAAGLSTNFSGSRSSGTVGATITQLGPITPTLDPVFQSVASYAHTTTPQPNQIVSSVTSLIQNTRNYNESISQGILSGGQVTLAYQDSYLNENAPTDLLNPSNGVVLKLSARYDFLQGFGTAVNARTITVAKANLKIDELTFRNEVVGVMANVLNLYYQLAADYDDVKAKQTAVDVAQTFYENNKKQVQIGTMAPLDVTTAESQLATSQQDLVVSQTTLAQQQLQLKNVLSRDGIADPLVASADIIPLDRISVPQEESMPPLKQLIATAIQNRPDLKAEQLNIVNLNTNALATENTLLPLLLGVASTTNQGLSGTPQYVVVKRNTGQTQTSGSPIRPGFVACPPSTGAPPGSLCEYPDPYFIGGIGTGLGQMIRRNFPSENAGAYFAPTLRNRVAQADYAIDQLSIRQSQLQTKRDLNQVAVDVSNQSIGVQQARVRYLASVKSRVLNQELLDAEQKRFALGASTTFLVVQQQRNLATAQAAETAALVTYSSARIGLDQTLGTLLQTNNISIAEAKSATVPRKSSLPEKLPE